MIKSNDKKYSNCLCEMFHRYIKCFYIQSRIKNLDWKFDLSILKMIKIKIAKVIDEIKLTIDRILRRNADTTNKEKETRKSNKSNNVSIEISKILFIRFSRCSQLLQSILYCINYWIAEFLTARQIHVCNDSLRLVIATRTLYFYRRTFYFLYTYTLIFIHVQCTLIFIHIHSCLSN